MKRHIKIVVSACVFAASAIGGAIQRLFAPAAQPHLTILYYHGVPKASMANFQRQMAMLARRARVVAADWDGGGLEDEPAHRRPTVAITFDDAFDSVIDNAVPVLAAHGFHCTIFAPSGWLGRHPSWSIDTAIDSTERVADAPRLSNVSCDSIAIGSHSVTHPRLSAIALDAARHEIEQSMQDLTAITGRHVRSFAFPYGDHNESVIELCRSAGYTQVYTIKPIPVVPGSGALVRGRVAVDPDDGPLEFLLKLTGSYRWMTIASAIKRKVALFRKHGRRSRGLSA